MHQLIDAFIDTWMDEFGRAVEMFSGALPALVRTNIEALPPDAAAYLWRKHIFSGSDAFDSWIGAAEAAWSELGNADPDNPRDTYFEILNQAQTGAGTVTSRGLDHPIAANSGETMPEADFDPAAFAIYRLTIDSGRIPDLFIAVQRTALAMLQSPEEAFEDAEPQEVRDSLSPDAPGSDRLLDLELPVAISLGFAELPVRAVPAMKAGAVIELSKETGEDVELLVHGTVVARGEITLVRGNYGLRIKHIVGANDRLTLLRK